MACVRFGLERDWREALGTSPGSAGKGKPELTEAWRAEGIPEGASHPSAAVGQGRSPERRKGKSSACRLIGHFQGSPLYGVMASLDFRRGV